MAYLTLTLDLASQAMLDRMTGGQLYLYRDCVAEQADVWGTRLQAELSRNLTRRFGYEGVMRFRCSKGLCVDQYLMGYSHPGELDVDVPGIDADSAFAVTFKHDDKLEDNGHAYVQCALLYTSSCGKRRIRVLTLGVATTSLCASVYRYADLDATLNVMMRRAALMTMRKNMNTCREEVISTCVDILFTYRKMCASNTAAGQLILPESLKLLPLYVLSLTKSGLLRAGTEVRTDERSALLAAGSRMPVGYSSAFVYPRLFALHSLPEAVGALDTDGSPHLPPSLPLSLEKLEPDGSYLVENGVEMLVWIGRAAPATFLSDVLQVQSQTYS